MTLQQTSRPLVTFALFSYNQRSYITEAVLGALGQDYPCLEIILSDDCSSDGTFEAMQEMARQYSGPHAIIVRQTKSNIGLACHINDALGHSNGDFIVVAAGDDISYSNRASRLVDAWQRSGRLALSVFSNVDIIDESGEKVSVWNQSGSSPSATTPEVATSRGSVDLYGCAHGFDRRIISDFPPLRPDIVHEDEVLPFRSLLLGEIAYIDTPLAAYRRHGGNTFGGNLGDGPVHAILQKQNHRRRYQIAQYRQWADDLDCSGSMVSAERRDAMRKQIMGHIRVLERTIELSEAPLHRIPLASAGALMDVGLWKTFSVFRRSRISPYVHSARWALRGRE